MRKSLFSKVCIVLFVLLISKSLISQILPPYYNNFDSFDSTGWSHYAISGTDDWILTAPTKYYFPSANTLPNAWVTNKTGNFAGNSNRALQTPCFDLTDTTQTLVFSFDHKTQAGSAGNSYYVEYSLNSGTTWSVLTNTLSPSKNWQSIYGFGSYYVGQFTNSAIRIKFLQGNPSVCFRFRFNSAYSNGDGWLIDDFNIKPEYYNITATQGDTIRNLNHFFTQFPLKFNYQFYNQYSSNYTFINNFYLSTDPIKDASDIAIGTRTLTSANTVTNWTNTFGLPTGLSAGYYYILYDLDVTNNLAENNETDNSNFAVLLLDSIYNTNYSDNFDSLVGKWNTAFPSGSTTWTQGPPNYFRIEKAHSGNNAFSTTKTSTSLLLESPYLDLSHQTNQSICFWYKSTYNVSNSNMTLKLPLAVSYKTSAPIYYYNVVLPQPKNNNWDCFCYKLNSTYDTVISTKFAIYPSNLSIDAATNIWSYERNAVDDIYIGESKPDVSVEFREGYHYTSSNFTTDTLYYYLYNSGLAQLPSTITQLYWSNDSILDAGDVLISSVNEPTITDTSSIKRKIAYSKPNNSAGTYFLIYKLDATAIVNEMREYNNLGYVKVIQQSNTSLPYYNDFENQTTNWDHFTSLGTSDWLCTTPNKPNISTAFSGIKAWLTGTTPTVAPNSKMHLTTPIFDLTQLNHPVLEFDMKLLNYWVNNYNSWPFNSMNMTYSIDGGLNWTVLDTTNKSFARWYHQMEMETINGEDRLYINNGGTESSNLLAQKDQKVFQNYLRYQTRDGLNTSHYVLDLNFLKTQKKIIFRFNYANVNAPVDGAMIDNFKISEATIDFAINHKKNILAAPTDKFIATFFDVNNNGNYIAPQTDIKLFLSNDSILDGSDILFSNRTVDALRPERKFYCNVKGNTTLLNTGKQYLIYQIDSQNLVAESDETNNIGYFRLSNNSAVPLPYFNNFDSSIVDGWSTYNDSTGYYHFHRFRNKLIIEDYAYQAQDGEWFLDPLDQQGYNISLSSYPIYYLTSPTFNFSGSINYQLEFDVSCVGNYYSGGQGGNLQYSSDGGLTWNVISNNQDPNALNLYYASATIGSLNNQPGWNFWLYDSNCKINLSFLTGLNNVRFRFAYKGKHTYTYPGEQGFRMDNFKISALLTTDITSLSNNSSNKLFYMHNNKYEIINNGECADTQINVFDVQGKTVSNDVTSLCSDNSRIKLDLSNVKPGMYLIHLNQNNTTQTFKVIVN